jgi:YlmC/YmxH family sporulation protein
MRLSDLQNKDIVDVNDGKNIGSIIDVKIDEDSGNIISFIIEPNKNFFKFLNRGTDTEISWQNITKIGKDVILVKLSV